MRIEFSPKTALVIVFFFLIAVYAIFQARFIILGPLVDVESPTDGSSINTPLLAIHGLARNTTFISMNDRPIFIDQNGQFNEKLIVPIGPSIIKFKARDRFGRETEKIIRIVMN